MVGTPDVTKGTCQLHEPPVWQSITACWPSRTSFRYTATRLSESVFTFRTGLVTPASTWKVVLNLYVPVAARYWLSVPAWPIQLDCCELGAAVMSGVLQPGL